MKPIIARRTLVGSNSIILGMAAVAFVGDEQLLNISQNLFLYLIAEITKIIVLKQLLEFVNSNTIITNILSYVGYKIKPKEMKQFFTV
jgi:hypothetical protein